MNAPAPTQDANVRTENTVAEMVDELSIALELAIGEIHSVNAETKVLSLNARIEAARAGTYGAAFGTVAEEMQSLSEKTEKIASVMATRTREKTAGLMNMIGTSVRGTRLGDLALVNIDMIDRNLYERTCDVRWWASDLSLVDALADPTPDAVEFAAKRLGVILRAYTVYHDLVLCNTDGIVIANGRPDLYDSVGRDVSSSEWFRCAMQSNSGDDYGFESAHDSSLVRNQPSLIYSAGVREGGESDGRLIGALGVVFNWSGLAAPVLRDIPVAATEAATTRAYLVTHNGDIIASRGEERLGESLPLPEFHRLAASDKGFYVADFGGTRYCIGHAKAPGFEGYSTGWYSLVMQPQ